MNTVKGGDCVFYPKKINSDYNYRIDVEYKDLERKTDVYYYSTIINFIEKCYHYTGRRRGRLYNSVKCY